MFAEDLRDLARVAADAGEPLRKQTIDHLFSRLRLEAMKGSVSALVVVRNYTHSTIVTRKDITDALLRAGLFVEDEPDEDEMVLSAAYQQQMAQLYAAANKGAKAPTKCIRVSWSTKHA